MKKILIISKDENSGGSIETINHMVMSLNLKILGIVGDYATAITYIEQDLPDLIVCDVTLNKDYDGLDILKKISKKYPIASILITKGVNTNFMKQAQGIKVVGYLTKPFVFSQVKITLQLSLDWASSIASK